MSEVNAEQATSPLPISVGAVSEIGLREQNQDCMTGFSSPFGAVYLIADGMGGHHGGAEASRMVAEGFSRHLLDAPASSPLRDAITLAVRLTNIEILEKGKSGNAELEGMGSTVAIALLRKGESGLELTTAHVGDSRIYLHRGGELKQLTKDHTQVQWLLDNNVIDEAAARNHPDASVLTRALGHTTDLQVDISDPIPIAEGDAILMCSDGLSGFASAEDIDRTIAENLDPSTCARQLVQLALDSGSNDNITVQLLRIGTGVPAVPARPKHTTQLDREAFPSAPAIPVEAPIEARVPARPGSRYTVPGIISIVAAVLALAGIAFWWVHSHRPAGNDEDVKKLGDRLDTFRSGVTSLEETAKKDVGKVDKDINLVAKRPDADELKKNLKALKEDFQQLERSAEALHKQNGKYDDEFKSIKNASDKAERAKAVAALNDELDQSEGGAGGLNDDNSRLAEREKTMATLDAQAQESKGSPQSHRTHTHKQNGES